MGLDVVWRRTVEYAEHIVLVKGEVAGEEPVLVRVHDFNPLDDVLGDLASGREGKLQQAMQDIAEAGKGVLIVIREPRQTRVSELVMSRLAGDDHAGLRDYGVGAQILTGQAIAAGNWDDNVDSCATLVIDRALTGTETALVTAFLNQQAGV